MPRFEKFRSTLSKACYEKILTCAAYALLFCYAADLGSSLCAIISYFILMVLKLAGAVNQFRTNFKEISSKDENTLQK